MIKVILTKDQKEWVKQYVKYEFFFDNRPNSEKEYKLFTIMTEDAFEELCNHSKLLFLKSIRTITNLQELKIQT